MTGAAPRGHLPVVTTERALAHKVAPTPGVPGVPGAPGMPSEPPPPPVPGGSRPTLEPFAVPASSDEPGRRFRALYDAHVDFVWRNLLRLGVHLSEVDDRTQEAFVVAYRRFGEFEDRGHGPRAWLFQIVLRIASEARRHRRRHPEDPDGGEATARASVAATQADVVAHREAVSLLDAALDTIDVGRRVVLVLHEIEEMTAAEIAHVIGIPLNTVYSRLRVARVELEEALSRQRGAR